MKSLQDIAGGAFRRRVRRGSAAGFTLVELLVVMAIIVVLLTITFSSFRTLGSSNRHAAVSAVMGVLDQARIRAISDGKATYVVFASPPVGQAASASLPFPNDLWGRGYALYQDADNINFKPQQVSGWMTLPSGIAFKRNNDGGAAASVTTEPRGSADTSTFFVRATVSGRSNRDMTLPYLKFDSTGSLVDYKGDLVDASSPSLRLLIFEGIVSPDGTELATRRVASSAGDASKRLVEQIDIKPTTGRAKYVLDPLDNLASATP